ncbi:hypothetical protein BASA81_006655 [Batrachochytrium salamandrivorans]|nr:hypothetical protein BASA81_006655 [Batrachochytrium salamandrivorans]
MLWRTVCRLSTSAASGLSIDRMLKQTKAAYPNCLTLIQIGDFYEMLGSDARKGSEILGITLTKRDRHKPTATDMAGIPVKSLKPHLQKFARAGEKVVIVDQIGEKLGLGNMHREVVRVVTPGTLCEDELLNPGQSNFLASLVLLPNKAAGEAVSLAWTDVSTTDGTRIQTTTVDVAEEVLRRIAPKEILLIKDQHRQLESKLPFLFDEARHEHVISLVDAPTQQQQQQPGLDPVKSISGVEHRALQCLREYVTRTLMPKSFDWTTTHRQLNDQHMMIDSHTRQALEVVASAASGKSLFTQIDFTVTSGGTRLLRSRLESPTLDLAEITQRLDSVDFLLRDSGGSGGAGGLAKHPLYGQVQQQMRPLRDPTRALQRLIVGRWSVKDLGDIYLGLQAGRCLADEVLCGEHVPQEIQQCAEVLAGVLPQPALVEEGLDTLSRNWPRGQALGVFPATEQWAPKHSLADLHNEFAKAFGVSAATANGEPAALDRPRVINHGYNAHYDHLLEQVNSQSTIASILHRLQHDYHIKIRIEYTEKSGHFVEVPKSVTPVLLKFPEVFKPMRVGTNRFTTVELDAFNRTHKTADEELNQCEQVLLTHLGALAVALRQELASAFHSLCVVDVAASSARAARELGLTRPTVSASRDLRLVNCRHVVVEQSNPNFVGNDLFLQAEGTPSAYLITGPNMGGKSTYLRSCALVPVLAQSGVFVPCDSAEVGLVDRIFARIGAADDLFNNRSTFMVEMEETANLLQHATSRSLVIVDELGRGTSPTEGLCLAQAVLEELVNVGCRTLFATHFHALAESSPGSVLMQSPQQILPYTTQVLTSQEGEEELVFTFKIQPGVAKSSFGMNVARLAGLPRGVLDRAVYLLTKV